MLTFNFNKYSLHKEGLMLDVGCGEGRHVFGVMQNYPQIRCVGLDMDEDSLKKAQEDMLSLNQYLRLALNL